MVIDQMAAQLTEVGTAHKDCSFKLDSFWVPSISQAEICKIQRTISVLQENLGVTLKTGGIYFSM